MPTDAVDKTAVLPGAGIGSRYAQWALAAFTLVFFSNATARFAPSIILEPMKAHFGLDDTAAGFVGGMALSMAYAATVLPMGWLSDRVNRRRMLAFTLGVASLGSMLGGLAQNFWQLVATRIAAGAMQSPAGPLCLSMISDVTPLRGRAAAVGVIYVGAYVGNAAAFVAGGIIAAQFGWSTTLLVAGLPGLLLSLVILTTLRDTPRGDGSGGAASAETAPGLLTTLRVLAGLPAIRQAAIAMTIAAVSMGAVMVWLTSFLIRAHGLDIGTTGLVVGVGMGLAQAVGSTLAGRVADRVAADHPWRVGLVAAAALALAAPIGLMMVMTSSTPVAISLLMLLGLVLGGSVSPAYTFVLHATPPALRGSGIGFVNVVVNLVGVGGGPLLTGMLSDAFGGGDSLRKALACVLLINLWAAAHHLAAVRHGGRAARPA